MLGRRHHQGVKRNQCCPTVRCLIRKASLTGILDFVANCPGSRKNDLVLKNNLDGDDADKNVLHQRANALKAEWLAWKTWQTLVWALSSESHGRWLFDTQLDSFVTASLGYVLRNLIVKTRCVNWYYIGRLCAMGIWGDIRLERVCISTAGLVAPTWD